ncbi:MAG: DUF1634 domain-containing protein [Gemmatimonadales bacterium]
MTTPARPDPAAPHDTAVERLVSFVLRGGVIAAAIVTGAGGALYLARHGAERVDYAAFHGEPDSLRSLAGIVRGVAGLRAEWIIAAGLLLLIATPIARVAVLLVVFLRERDRLYVAVSAIVLAVLLMSLLDFSV